MRGVVEGVVEGRRGGCFSGARVLWTEGGGRGWGDGERLLWEGYGSVWGWVGSLFRRRRS